MPLFFLLVFLFSIAIAPAAYAAGGVLSGDGSSENPYLIEDEADLIAFRDIVNGDNGKTQDLDACAKLTQDITLEYDWTPIGIDEGYEYDGTFDGNGHTISGLKFNGTYSRVFFGLFGIIDSDGKVMNLTLENVNISVTTSSNLYAGAAAGLSYGTIEGCTVTEGTVSGVASDYACVGGIAGGALGSSSLTNCINSAEVSGEADDEVCVGGVAGIVYSSSLTNCINKANVSVSGDPSEANVGGVAGTVYSSSLTNCGYLQSNTVNKDINAIGYDNANDNIVTVTFSNENEINNNIVMTLSASIDPQSVSEDGKATITFSTSPGTPENAFDDENGAVRNVKVTLSNTEVASAEYANDGTGTITVTGLSEGETAITVTADLHATDLSTLGTSPSYLDDGTGLTFTFTLTVSNTEQDEDDSTETESETKSGGSGSGCNAGTGALALLTLIPFAMRRKR